MGNTAQFVGSVGDAFSAICCLQIFRFTSSKPSKSAIASDEKFIRLRTNSFVRYCHNTFMEEDDILVEVAIHSQQLVLAESYHDFLSVLNEMDYETPIHEV